MGIETIWFGQHELKRDEVRAVAIALHANARSIPDEMAEEMWELKASALDKKDFWKDACVAVIALGKHRQRTSK